MSSSTCARRILTICATPTSPISSSLRPYCCRPPVLSASIRSGLTTLGLAVAADEGRDGLPPLLGRGGMGGFLPPLLGRCVILV